MTSSIITTLLIFNFLSGAVNSPVYYNNAKVLKGNISESKDLPEEFYGTWSVTGKVKTTNDPILYQDKSSDIWLFHKFQNIITLSNPASGATASIVVDEVQNKTATFTRTKFTAKFKEYEKAVITVNGDNFYGTDILIYKTYIGGKLISTSTAEYTVSGSKISGPTLEDVFAK